MSVQAAGQSLLQELPHLFAEPFSAAAPAELRAVTVERLLPRFIVRYGGAPKLRRPDDWTALSMFGLGLLLFIVSWIIAAWDRGSRAYRTPLLSGEAAPAPEPPHIIYSLSRRC